MILSSEYPLASYRKQTFHPPQCLPYFVVPMWIFKVMQLWNSSLANFTLLLRWNSNSFQLHTMKEKEETGEKLWFWTFKWKYVTLFRDNASRCFFRHFPGNAGVLAWYNCSWTLPAEPSQAPFCREQPLLALIFFFFFHKVNGKWNTDVSEEMSYVLD